MQKEQIGYNAGKIWHMLEKDLTNTNIKKLKKELNMNSIEIGAALGWLARENKITFISENKTIYVFPINK